MRLNRKVLTLIISIFFLEMAYSQTQEVEEYIHRYIGIGIRSSVFQISELPTKTIPPNRIFVNVDPIKYLRVEGHYGIYSNEHEVYLGSNPPGKDKLTLKENSTLLGGGIFGVYPKGCIKYILGVRYSQNKYEQDVINASYSTPYPNVVTNHGEIDITSTILGAEFYFNKWFSIGGEFGIVNLNDVFTPWDTNEPSITTKTLITESSLLFRFHPY